MKTLEVLDKVLKGKRLRPATQRHYRDALTSLSVFSPEWSADSGVINEWLASLTGFADTTVKMWFNVVHSAGRYIKKVYKLPNPCEDAERPKVSKRRRRYFTSEEMVAIIKACVTDFEVLLILTLVDSACRIGELAHLTGADVGDGFINVTGKTGQRRYRCNSQICVKLRSLAGGDSEAVFKQKWTGGFFPDGNALAHRVRYVVQRAGVQGAKCGVHTLRHSSASLVAQEAGEALIVKALLQHDDISTSMGYIHDVDELVIRDDKYSPLRILGQRYSSAHPDLSGEQLELSDGQGGGSVALVPASGKIKELVGVGEFINDLFPVVADGVAVRAVLRCDDLRLIRDAFIFYAQYHDGNSVARARGLLKRIYREALIFAPKHTAK